jgi:hypothetical protein
MSEEATEKWERVTRQEWIAWCNLNGVTRTINRCHEPAIIEGIKNGRMVAFAKLFEGHPYHGGRPSEYFLPTAAKDRSAERNPIQN